jgi:predicted small secreted protein
VGDVRNQFGTEEGGRVKVKDIWDIFGAIILVALVAVILTKKNTARDVSATGKAFSGALATAERG